MKSKHLPMTATLAFCLVFAGFVNGGGVRAERPADFGKCWVRTHPFTLTALTLRPGGTEEPEFNLRRYRDAGLNALLLWKPRSSSIQASLRENFPIHMHVRRSAPIDIDAAKAHVTKYAEEVPTIDAWMVFDEPRPEQIHDVAEMVKWIKTKYPDKLVYSNLGGDGSQWDYVRAMAQEVRPDVMSYNVYPFRKAIPTKDIFHGMLEVRRASMAAGLPYWTFIQAWGHKTDAPETNRVPSESELRMHVFAHLAAGFTGISYYSFDEAEGTGMVDLQGSPLPIYSHVQSLNREVANLGETLKKLTSTDICFLRSPNSVLSQPTWLGEIGLQMRKEIGIADIEEATKQGQDVQIGAFRNDEGTVYFMIVNLWTGPDLDAAAATRRIQLTLAPGTTSLQRVSRGTGMLETLKPIDGKVSIELPGGTGDLFRVVGR